MMTVRRGTGTYPRRSLWRPAWVVVCLLAGMVAGCGGGGGSQTATIHVNSSPEQGALVKVGANNYGVTPTRVTGIPAGQIYLILTLDGYRRAAELVEVPEEGEISVTVSMERLVGHVTFESTPAGAKVYLGGVEYIGETPLVSYQLPVDTYEYEMRLDNYYTLRDEIMVERDRTYTRKHNLAPMGSEIQVLSRPSGADIYVNDQIQNDKTPSRFALPPGSYTIGVYQKGFLLAEENIELKPNEFKPLEFELEPGDMPPGMVLIPAGEFVFGTNDGAPDEGPQRTEYLDAYYIDKFEVTNKAYKEVVPTHTFDPKHELMPVTGVSWNEASDYARAVGKRLPTEMEWEKAARGPEGWLYPWGNTFRNGLANVNTGPNPALTEIGSHRAGASKYLVMDMAGNAYEWTADWYNAYEGNREIETEYGNRFRVLRGGSFRSDPYDARSVKRHFDSQEGRRSDYGFRCVMDIPRGSDRRGPGQSQTSIR